MCVRVCIVVLLLSSVDCCWGESDSAEISRTAAFNDPYAPPLSPPRSRVLSQAEDVAVLSSSTTGTTPAPSLDLYILPRTHEEKQLRANRLEMVHVILLARLLGRVREGLALLIALGEPANGAPALLTALVREVVKGAAAPAAPPGTGLPQRGTGAIGNSASALNLASAGSGGTTTATSAAAVSGPPLSPAVSGPPAPVLLSLMCGPRRLTFSALVTSVEGVELAEGLCTRLLQALRARPREQQQPASAPAGGSANFNLGTSGSGSDALLMGLPGANSNLGNGGGGGAGAGDTTAAFTGSDVTAAAATGTAPLQPRSLSAVSTNTGRNGRTRTAPPLPPGSSPAPAGTTAAVPAVGGTVASGKQQQQQQQPGYFNLGALLPSSSFQSGGGNGDAASGLAVYLRHHCPSFFSEAGQLLLLSERALDAAVTAISPSGRAAALDASLQYALHAIAASDGAALASCMPRLSALSRGYRALSAFDALIALSLTAAERLAAGTAAAAGGAGGGGGGATSTSYAGGYDISVLPPEGPIEGSDGAVAAGGTGLSSGQPYALPASSPSASGNAMAWPPSTSSSAVSSSAWGTAGPQFYVGGPLQQQVASSIAPTAAGALHGSSSGAVALRRE